MTLMMMMMAMITLAVTEQRSVYESMSQPYTDPFFFKAKALIIFRKPLQLRNLRIKRRWCSASCFILGQAF